MGYYRLYFFDGLSGRVADFHAFEAPSDEAAMAEAERHRRLVGMELWSGQRKVQRWAALCPAKPFDPPSAALPS